MTSPDEAKAQMIRLAERFAVRVLEAPRDERTVVAEIERGAGASCGTA